MFRAIIIDRLLERELKTKKCITENEAGTEGQNSIIRLCKKYHVSIDSNRFFVACIEIESNQ